MEGKYEFCSPEWDDITDLPKDFVRIICWKIKKFIYILLDFKVVSDWP